MEASLILAKREDLKKMMRNYDLVPLTWKWIREDVAAEKLGISVKTLRKLRDEGYIRHTKVTERNVLYDVESIDKYLEKQSRKAYRM